MKIFNIKRPRKRYLAITGLALAALAAPMAASAKSPPPATAKPVLTPTQAAQTQSSPATGARSPQAAQQYWTPARMQQAAPKDMPAVQPGQATQTAPPLAGPQGAVAPTAPTGATVAPRAAPTPASAPYGGTWPATYNQTQARVDGRVFFTDNAGYDYSCSATVVNSIHKTVVWTAGHCVFDITYACSQPTGFYHNWVFIPGYKNGTAPYGVWTAHSLTVPSGWCNGTWPSAIPYDTGAVNMNALNGRAIATALGGNGISWNRAGGVTDRLTFALGYPAAAPFNGTVLRWCQGPEFIDYFTGSAAMRPMGLVCQLTGGASGGPWLLDNAATGNPRTGYATVNGQNSYKFDDPNTIYSPQYLTAQGNLYNAVK